MASRLSNQSAPARRINRFPSSSSPSRRSLASAAPGCHPLALPARLFAGAADSDEGASGKSSAAREYLCVSMCAQHPPEHDQSMIRARSELYDKIGVTQMEDESARALEYERDEERKSEQHQKRERQRNCKAEARKPEKGTSKIGDSIARCRYSTGQPEQSCSECHTAVSPA